MASQLADTATAADPDPVEYFSAALTCKLFGLHWFARAARHRANVGRPGFLSWQALYLAGICLRWALEEKARLRRMIAQVRP